MRTIDKSPYHSLTAGFGEGKASRLIFHQVSFSQCRFAMRKHCHEERHSIRGHQGPREIQALRAVVFRNVFLHLWRLLRALSDWEIAGTDRGKDASRWHLSRGLAGDGIGHDNSESDAVSVARPAGRSESLAEYFVWHSIQRDHDSGD